MERSVGSGHTMWYVGIAILLLIVVVAVFLYIGYKNSLIICKADSDCALTDICNKKTGICEHSSCFSGGTNNCQTIPVTIPGASTTAQIRHKYWCVHGTCMQCKYDSDFQGLCMASCNSVCSSGVCTHCNPQAGTC